MSNSTTTLDRPPTPRPAGRPDGGGAGFRPDIEGLRAVAVLLVVLGHAGVPLVTGGYVGVDVFFVISGFLITSLLLREAERTGRVSIARFYARRALRLLPAAALVLVTTLLAARFWLPPIRTGELAGDALAAAGYAANLRFAQTGTDYLEADVPPSPFQHFWSLAVEEQFYLFWPLLVLLAARLWPGRRRPLAALLGVGVAASFVASLTETQRSAPWAYFGPHTRAWELGVGALLALAPWAGFAGRRIVLGAAGLAAIAGAALCFDETTPYPGYHAVLPVAGAAALLAARFRALEARPLQLVGRLSYGWYLWHWPLLLIGPHVLDRPATTTLNLLLAVVALGLAWVTHHLVENPVRRHRWLRARPVRGLAVGAVLSAAVAGAAATVALLPNAVHVGAPARDLRASLDRAQDPSAALARAVAAGHRLRELPANMTPTLQTVNADKARVWADKCHVEAPVTEAPAGCVYGDPAGATTVVLFGDSHAAHWFPAMELLAQRHGWRLVSLSKSSCSAADLPLWHDGLRRTYTECAAFHDSALARIRTLRPALVVIGSSFNYRPAQPGDEERQWRAAWDRTFTDLTATGARVAAITDTPYMGDRVPICLARRAEARQIDRCGKRLGAALRGPAQRKALLGYARSGVTIIDPVPWLCSTFCPPVVGNVLVYRDSNHLTTTYARMVAPLLDARLPRLR